METFNRSSVQFTITTRIVLVVLTSQGSIPANNHPTGWYLPEFAHPWEILHEKTEFLAEQKSLWMNTIKLSTVLLRVFDFDAVFYVGGHGPMFYLHHDETSIALIETFSALKKPIAAVCHGPAVLLKAKAPSGKPLLSSATITGFSNAEEDQAQMSAVMPYMLEDELQRVLGNYVKAEQPWGEKVVVSKMVMGGIVITGQNPASATGVGREILKALI